jgi:hypothetical protein
MTARKNVRQHSSKCRWCGRKEPGPHAASCPKTVRCQRCNNAPAIWGDPLHMCAPCRSRTLSVQAQIDRLDGA